MRAERLGDATACSLPPFDTSAMIALVGNFETARVMNNLAEAAATFEPNSTIACGGRPLSRSGLTNPYIKVTDAGRLQIEAAMQEFEMANPRREFMNLLRQRQMALSWWKNDGGAGPDPLQSDLVSGPVQSAAPPLTNTELVQLQIRVIALENLVITLLAEASDRQLARAREMAAYILPRPGFTRHPLTIHAAAEMINLVDRAEHFRVRPPL